MNLVLLGPPGAGKGTQAKYIASGFNLDHVSSGDLLREAVKSGTELGIKAKAYMDSGSLVPDSMVIDLIKKRITGKGKEKTKGFLLDGFPRNIEQAKALRSMLIEIKKKIDLALNIEVNDGIILQRLSGRRSCGKCGQPYSIFFKKPKLENVCDICCGDLIQRDDDTIATIRERITNYKRLSLPLLDYYKNDGILINVNGDKDMSDVSKDIERVLRKD